MNCIRYMSSSNPISVIAATPVAYEPAAAPASYLRNVDRRMEATLGLPKDIIATITCDLGVPHTFGLFPKIPQIKLKVEGEIGSLEMFNFVLPTLYHSITVKIKGGHTRVEKIYKGVEGKGEEWWTTYRFQLEALVDRVRGREPEVWLEKQDSVDNMEWIEKVYEKVCISFVPNCLVILTPLKCSLGLEVDPNQLSSRLLSDRQGRILQGIPVTYQSITLFQSRAAIFLCLLLMFQRNLMLFAF